MKKILKVNKVYLGDNLIYLKQIDDESIDLIYIDPPFFTQTDWEDFKDTWESLEQYLNLMQLRIIEIYRILKKSGCLYLHCDWHSDSYLRILCDKIFGHNNLINKITWQRHKAHKIKKKFVCFKDTILFYSKTSNYVFNIQRFRNDENLIKNCYHFKDKNGDRFGLIDLCSTIDRKNYEYLWNGIKKNWRIPIESMRKLEKNGNLYYGKNKRAYKKRYWREYIGTPLSDLWIDIVPKNDKRLYSTQKPQLLLERIIKTSSNEGDIILDCYLGSGTTCVVAKKLNRRYIGIDNEEKAITIAKERLKNTSIRTTLINYI